MRGFTLLFFLFCSMQVWGQKFSISGRVLDGQKQEPIGYATVAIEGSSIGTITDEKGIFVIENLSSGTYKLQISCLGYAKNSLPIKVKKDISGLEIKLQEMNLALDEVTVTAQRKVNDATTAYSMDRTVLDHLQGISVSDVIGLLPGEQTNKAQSLTTSQTITLRGSSQEMGNPDFGTVIEMDGVRLSGNASGTGGTDVRNIGNSNVERVDVISGVPSVEYGDFTNGIVKVVTRKGKTPLTADVSIRPHTQTYAVSKGFNLFKKGGVINLSYERARSVSDIASPYTSYIRNAFGLRYSNTLQTQKERQISMELGLNGNVGGLDSKSDPDAFKNTYLKVRDNALRANLSFSFRANSPWLSDLRWGATFSYADNLKEERINKSASSSEPAVHSMQNGYFVASKYEDNPSAEIILLPTGYWYTNEFTDNKPLNYKAYLKARWSHRLHDISSNLLVGTEWKGEQNAGQGNYYDDMRYAPTWRPYRLDELPMMHNWSAYVEEEVKVPFKHSRLLVKAGVRSDQTLLSGSEYGSVGSFSPRVNAKYTFAESSTKFIQGITLRAGWGKAVKLPSFEILYPRETYVDRLAFASTSMSDGTAYYAYHTEVVKPRYNQNLKWQYNIMREVGSDIRMKGVNVSLSFFYNTMYRPYTQTKEYQPFDYKFTDQKSLSECLIPSADRKYQIDHESGIVQVIDKKGTHPSEVLAYREINDFRSSYYYMNGSSSSRIGLEWILDFDKIKVLNTSFRIDGKYYQYKGVDELITPYRSTLNMSNGQPYKYVGYYVGGANNFNGSKTKRLNLNMTVVTHVPKIRMIFSLRVEGTFINSSQNLSEYDQGDRSFVIDDRNDYFPAPGNHSIYDGDHYVASYPLYYVSRENMQKPIPFREAFTWAHENDPQLYSDLSALVIKTNTGYVFKNYRYSPYFSANINVTKEIGKYLTLSFFANNFFYSMQKIKAHHTNTEESLFDSGRISPFNYGISIKFKL